MSSTSQTGPTVRYFHRTDAATEILSDGFRDGTGTYLTGEFHQGVWISDRPLDGNEGAADTYLLAVDVPHLVAARFDQDHEWIEDGKPYREWLVPADDLNRHAVVSILETERARYPDLSVTFAEILDRHRISVHGDDHMECLDCGAVWYEGGTWWQCPEGCNQQAAPDPVTTADAGT